MKFVRIITDSLWMIPFFLVLSTVFIINRDLVNGVVTIKYFWFYASMGVISAVTLLRVMNEELRIMRFTILDFLVLLFVGSILFSSLVINDASQNTTKLALLALLAVLYFNFRLFIKSGETKAQISIYFFIILTGLIEAVWGLRQIYGFIPSQHSLFKLTGSFFNPGPYAGYLAAVFPLALHVFLELRTKSEEIRVKSEKQRIKSFLRFLPSFLTLKSSFLTLLALGSSLLILIVLPAAMSRASWLAAVAGSLIVLTAHYSKNFILLRNYFKAHKKKMALLGIIVGILLFAAFAGMYSLKKDSADGRTLMWKIALQTAKKHPLGVGLGNFSGAYGDAQAAYFSAGKGTETEEHVAGSPDYGFNEYLQIAVESGVISLILFMAIILLSFRTYIINRKWGVAGSMSSLLVFAFFSYPFSVLPFLLIFVFLLAEGNNNGAEKRNTNNNLCPIIIASFSILISFYYLYKEIPVYRAYKKWNTSKTYYSIGLYKDVSKDYEELYPLLNDQIQFLFEYAQSLSKSERYTESNEILKRAMQISCDPMLYNIMGKNYQALNEYKQAETCFMKATHIIPNRLYPFYLLTKLYHEMGLQDKVNEMADMVQTKEPKVHSRAVEEMRQEVRGLRDKN